MIDQKINDRVTMLETKWCRAVERKLLSFPEVEGLVFGNWGEASKATHNLVEALATSRAQIGDPQARSKRGNVLTEKGVKSLAVGYIRRKLGIASAG